MRYNTPVNLHTWRMRGVMQLQQHSNYCRAYMRNKITMLRMCTIVHRFGIIQIPFVLLTVECLVPPTSL